MTTARLLGLLVLPAVGFALAYPFILIHLSRSVISPYTKADVGKRLFAAAIDSALVIMTAVVVWPLSSVICVTGAGG